MSKKRNSKSYEVALSGISCAIAVIFLALGILSEWLLATGYFIGILALMVPLSKKFYLGDFLAHIGTCILTVIMGAAAKFWDIVPFAMFFGLHPLINALQLKLKSKAHINAALYTFLAFLIKAVWFDATLIVGYFLVYDGVLGGSLFPESVYEAINRYIYLIIFVGGTIIFAAYDFLIFRCQRSMDYFVARLKI